MGNVGCCACGDKDKSDLESPRPLLVPHEAESEGQKSGLSGISPRQTARAAPSPRRRAALAALAVACAGDDADAIERALQRGQSAGLHLSEMAGAREAAARAARRRQARRALAEAMRSREEGALRAAVSLADAVALDGGELERALECIQELEGAHIGREGSADLRRAAAVGRLERAIRSRGQQELEGAIAEAEQVGLGAKAQRALLAEARVTLHMVLARRRVAQERRARERAEQAAAAGSGASVQQPLELSPRPPAPATWPELEEVAVPAIVVVAAATPAGGAAEAAADDCMVHLPSLLSAPQPPYWSHKELGAEAASADCSPGSTRQWSASADCSPGSTRHWPRGRVGPVAPCTN